MKVKELIEALKECDPEQEVFFYEDHEDQLLSIDVVKKEIANYNYGRRIKMGTEYVELTDV